MSSRRTLPLLALILAVACSKSEPKKAEGESSEKSTSEKPKEGKKEKKSDDEESADEEAPKKKKKKDPVEVKAPERTKVPTLAEWNKAEEDEAKGNDVGCEVKSVREWVRVSCRKKSKGGGDPSAVVVERGRNKETFTYANKGVASIVTPLLPGTDLLAKFSWTDVVYAVRLGWRKDEERPKVFAHFVKTDDPPTKLLGVATCDCFKKTNKGGKCEESDEMWQMTAQNPWCEKAFASDCDMMIACARGEPSAKPKCPPNHVVSLVNYCLQKCKKTADCPTGYTCAGMYGDDGPLVCTEEG